MRLGFWQLSRAEYHQAIIDRAAQAQSETEQVNPALDQLDVFQRVALDGIWRNSYVLLDSQVAAGRIGYHVLQLFEHGEQSIWVDRGFIAVNNRDVLPELALPEQSRVVGEFYYAKAWQNQRSYIESMSDTVWRVSNLSDDALSALGQMTTVKGVLRLTQPQAAQLQANWPRVAINPDKNRAYALQWFAIAAVLMLAVSIFLWHNIANNKKDDANGYGNHA